MRYLLTGITGQIGTILSKKVKEKGHTVVGISRYQSSPDIIVGDICDKDFLKKTILEYKPDVVGNLAGKSGVAESFTASPSFLLKNTLPICNLLEISREVDFKLFQMGSLDEHSNSSPYALSKKFSTELCDLYRRLGTDVTVFRCPNMESKYRGANFLTKKVAQYLIGDKKEKLKLGDLSPIKRWCCAEEASDFILENMNNSTQDLLLGEACSCEYLVHQMFDLTNTCLSKIEICDSLKRNIEPTLNDTKYYSGLRIKDLCQKLLG
jgi:GDP-D-mannose dehydratase